MGFDSVELKVNDLVRHQFYDGFKNTGKSEKWVIAGRFLDSISFGNLHTSLEQTRTYLLLPRGQGCSGMGEHIWEGRGVTQRDLPKVNPRIRYRKRVSYAFFSHRRGYAETLLMILPDRFRSRSRLFSEKEDCNSGGPFPPGTDWNKEYEYDCSCNGHL
jgi:hypothetical protein